MLGWELDRTQWHKQSRRRDVYYAWQIHTTQNHFAKITPIKHLRTGLVSVSFTDSFLFLHCAHFPTVFSVKDCCELTLSAELESSQDEFSPCIGWSPWTTQPLQKELKPAWCETHSIFWSEQKVGQDHQTGVQQNTFTVSFCCVFLNLYVQTCNRYKWKTYKPKTWRKRFASPCITSLATHGENEHQSQLQFRVRVHTAEDHFNIPCRFLTQVSKNLR